jgi:hypothetical protein
MNWFAQSLQALQNLNTSLTENDLNALTLHYCSNLLIAGVIKQLDGSSDSFKVRMVGKLSFHKTLREIWFSSKFVTQFMIDPKTMQFFNEFSLKWIIDCVKML